MLSRGHSFQQSKHSLIYFTNTHTRAHTHTHTRTCTRTHTFNGPLSRTTWVTRYQKSKINLDFTEARDSEWQWHQLGHMQVCTLLQTDNHANTSPLSLFTGRMPFHATQPTASKHWRHKQTQTQRKIEMVHLISLQQMHQEAGTIHSPNKKTAFFAELSCKVTSRLPFPWITSKPENNFIKLLQLWQNLHRENDEVIHDEM